MDLDAFVSEHRGEWERLRQLTTRRQRTLRAEEVDELVALYHRATTHLSMVRSRAADPALVSWLSRLVLQARGALTPSPGFTLGGAVRFLTVSFPGEVYRAGRWCIGVAVAFVLLAGVRMAVVANDPHAHVPAGTAEHLVEHGFESYYSEYQAQNFALGVWTNNAYLAAICLAAGVLILPVVMVLWINVENIGLVGGVMVGYGRSDLFFQLLLVHGLLELTAIFIAAGVGLRIGWAWISPDPELSRSRTVARRARSGMVVALGLVVVLLISAGIEAFVTPAPVPIALRLAVGALIWLAVLAYLIGYGAQAVRGGRSADVAGADADLPPLAATPR